MTPQEESAPTGIEAPMSVTNAHTQDNAPSAESLAANLIENIRRAYAFGYNVEPIGIWWNPNKNNSKTGVRGDKDVVPGTARRGWQNLGRLPLAELERRVLAGEAQGYLVHGSTSCPHVGGVTLLDGDTEDECARISAAVGGAPAPVQSGSNWRHWYVRGVVKDSKRLKTKDTAFGPGTWYLRPDGTVAVYRGELPDPTTLPVAAGFDIAPVPEQPAYVAPGVVRPGSFFDDSRAFVLQQAEQRVRDLGLRKPEPNQNHDNTIYATARFLGEYLHLGSYTEEQARDAVLGACSSVWGRYDDDDLRATNNGLRYGQAAPKSVQPEYVSGGTSPDPTVAALGEPGAATGFDFAFLDPDSEPEPPEPARYGGFGGAPLFYERGVHWLQGESESGKSMVALAGPVIDAVRAGELVLYVDHEDTRARVQERLSQLGATRDELRRVCYVPAAEVPHRDIVAHLVTGGREYAVMVVDGVTSALSAAGLSGRDEQEVTRWVDDLPRRARMSVCVDHVVKAQDNRAGMAIGSQAKKSVVTGTAWEVVCTEKFGRGISGQVVLEIQKDKPGWVRGAGAKRVRLHVVSTPGTYALSVRVADGSVADPFDVWVRDQLRQGYRWQTAESLWRDAKAAGMGYAPRRKREQFDRYEQVLREYESEMPNGASWSRTKDQLTSVVPITGSSGTGTGEKTLSPGETPVPGAWYDPGTSGTRTAYPTPIGGYVGTATNGNGTQTVDTSAFFRTPA